MNVQPVSHRNSTPVTSADKIRVDGPGSSDRSGGPRLIKLLALLGVGGAISAVAVFFNYDRVFGGDSDAEDISSVIITEAISDPCEINPSEFRPGSITGEISQEIIEAAEHPLIPLLAVARKGITSIQQHVQDYSATITKRERVNGKLQPEQVVFCKIRHASDGSDGCIPFAAYTKFLKPKSVRGQEAIWVHGCNEGKLIAHTTGLLNVIPFHLEPDGPVAMRGNRHTIREIGMLNLVHQMIEKGERDRHQGECEVRLQRDVMVGDARCTRLEIIHPVPRDYFDFHIAKIYIDDDRNLPIAYEGYLWPEQLGGPPILLERYYYTNIQLNIGLADLDFDPANPDYDYPSER